MRALRRPQHETRIEIMPLIDVIFLLLTFFIYAMVLMVRAELLPVEMHAFASGEPAQVPPAVAITMSTFSSKKSPLFTVRHAAAKTFNPTRR